LYPEDLKLRAKVDCYLDWHHTNTRRAGNYMFGKLFAPSLGMKPAFNLDVTVIEVHKALKFID